MLRMEYLTILLPCMVTILLHNMVIFANTILYNFKNMFTVCLTILLYMITLYSQKFILSDLTTLLTILLQHYYFDTILWAILRAEMAKTAGWFLARFELYIHNKHQSWEVIPVVDPSKNTRNWIAITQIYCKTTHIIIYKFMQVARLSQLLNKRFGFIVLVKFIQKYS